jgi:hypothetical protein
MKATSAFLPASIASLFIALSSTSAHALLYKYDIISSQGYVGVEENGGWPYAVGYYTAEVTGFAYVDFDPLLFTTPFTIDSPLPFSLISKIEIHLAHAGYSFTTSGSVGWDVFGGGYDLDSFSGVPLQPFGLEAVTIEHQEPTFQFSFPSTLSLYSFPYYDYIDMEVWTKNVWHLGDLRYAPWFVVLGNGRQVPDAGGTAFLMGIALVGLGAVRRYSKKTF